jgi:MFS superfamily sulfate permease-like transporter
MIEYIYKEYFHNEWEETITPFVLGGYHLLPLCRSFGIISTPELYYIDGLDQTARGFATGVKI